MVGFLVLCVFMNKGRLVFLESKERPSQEREDHCGKGAGLHSKVKGVGVKVCGEPITAHGRREEKQKPELCISFITSVFFKRMQYLGNFHS